MSRPKLMMAKWGCGDARFDAALAAGADDEESQTAGAAAAAGGAGGEEKAQGEGGETAAVPEV